MSTIGLILIILACIFGSYFLIYIIFSILACALGDAAENACFYHTAKILFCDCCDCRSFEQYEKDNERHARERVIDEEREQEEKRK